MTDRDTFEICLAGRPVRVLASRNAEFWQSVGQGSWEPETFAIFDEFVEPDQPYIDVGAWIGPTVLYASGLAQAVYGIEPDPIAYAELTGNLALNRSLTEGTRVFNVCIAPKSGRVAFGSRTDGGDSGSSLLFANCQTRWTVDAVTFDQFMRQHQVHNCGFIKIDIEGGEYTVVPAMSDYLRRHRPAVYLSFHPHLLGSRGRRGLSGNLPALVAKRLSGFLSIAWSLGFYNYIYPARYFSPFPNRPCFLSRLRHKLDRITWKPVVLALACLHTCYGNGFALVFAEHRGHSRDASV